MKITHVITDIEQWLDPRTRYSRALQRNEWVMRATIAHDANDAQDRQSFHQRNQELNAICEINAPVGKPVYYFTPMDSFERFSGFRAMGLETHTLPQLTVLSARSPLKDVAPDAVWVVDSDYDTLRVVHKFLAQAKRARAFCVVVFVNYGNDAVWRALSN